MPRILDISVDISLLGTSLPAVIFVLSPLIALSSFVSAVTISPTTALMLFSAVCRSVGFATEANAALTAVALSSSISLAAAFAMIAFLSATVNVEKSVFMPLAIATMACICSTVYLVSAALLPPSTSIAIRMNAF